MLAEIPVLHQYDVPAAAYHLPNHNQQSVSRRQHRAQLQLWVLTRSSSPLPILKPDECIRWSRLRSGGGENRLDLVNWFNQLKIMNQSNTYKIYSLDNGRKASFQKLHESTQKFLAGKFGHVWFLCSAQCIKMADGLNENADALFDSRWPKYPGAQLSVSVSNSRFLCICNKCETRPPISRQFVHILWGG